jgi:nucleoside-diphosphate-sugar epimerase
MDYILVTGAAGFIGAHITQTLLNLGKNVIAIDCFLSDLYSSEIKRRRFEELKPSAESKLKKFKFDLRQDSFEVFANYNVTSIINLAAMPGLRANWNNSDTYYDCNLYALNRLLEYARNMPLEKFVQASTSSVYGKVATGSEDQSLFPISPYGISKLAAEHLIRTYSDTYGLPTVILSYFSVYGAGQRPDMAFAKIIDSLLADHVFSIFGSGSHSRSNTYIDDVVNATILSLESAPSGSLYNVCGGESITLIEAIRLLESISQSTLRVKFIESRLGDQESTKGDFSKISAQLGWTPQTSIKKGLTEQFNFAAEGN